MYGPTFSKLCAIYNKAKKSKDQLRDLNSAIWQEIDAIDHIPHKYRTFDYIDKAMTRYLDYQEKYGMEAPSVEALLDYLAEYEADKRIECERINQEFSNTIDRMFDAVSTASRPNRSSCASSSSGSSHSAVSVKPDPERQKRNRILAVTAVGVIALAILLFTLIIPSVKYNSAVSLVEQGAYAQAYALLKDIRHFKDAGELAKQYQWYGIKVGDTIPFGCYEQDNDTANGKEEIQWIVLAVEDGRALLISEYVLDALTFHTDGDSYTVNTTWENCQMRQWLNGEFLETAFSAEESARIALSALTNPDRVDAYYTVEGGEDTEDRLFILSAEEYDRYLANSKTRIAHPTKYAASKVRLWSTGNGADWRLRSPGAGQNFTQYISGRGYIQDEGLRCNSETGFRPALWVTLN